MTQVSGVSSQLSDPLGLVLMPHQLTVRGQKRQKFPLHRNKGFLRKTANPSNPDVLEGCDWSKSCDLINFTTTPQNIDLLRFQVVPRYEKEARCNQMHPKGTRSPEPSVLDPLRNIQFGPPNLHFRPLAICFQIGFGPP